jgi:hypothetical protein
MQRATGTATLGKVGVHVCSTVCPPIYYTVEESNYTDETLTDVLTGGVNCPPHNVTHHRRVNEGWITYDKFDAPDNPGPTLREGCYGTPKTITGVATGEVSLTGAGDDNCTASGTAASGVMNWMPPECYNAIGNALDQVPLEEISSQNRTECDFTETETVYQYIYYPTGCGSSTKTKTVRTGTKWSNIFTTTELETTVQSRAASRLSSTFTDGDAVSFRSIGSDQVCAGAQKAKYRIHVTGYVPNTQYIIKYKVVARHRDGTSTSAQRRVSARSPASGEWYFPSAAGAMIADPPWPTGPCIAGVNAVSYTESITYTDVTIEEK